MPAISVVIITYNVEDYVIRTLSSVLDQEFDDIEIIVVDDGSTDATPHRCADLLKAHSNARIVVQTNAGPGGARNTGLAQANGQYVLYLDGDDWLAPGALSTLWKFSLGADIILSNRRRYWEKNARYTTEPLFKELQVALISQVPDAMKIIAVHGKMFKRDFLISNDIKFPTGMSSEDFVFTYCTYAYANIVVTIPKVTYFYRKRGNANNQSLTQARLTEFNLTSRFKQIEMTQHIVRQHDLTTKFPNVDFFRVDFEKRLMRHVDMIPIATADVRIRSFELVRTFLVAHEPLVMQRVSTRVRAIYSAIIDRKNLEAINLINERNNTKR